MKTTGVIFIFIVYVTYEVTAKVAVKHCRVTTEDYGHRIDENSIEHDCGSDKCGGQCVALVKCRCGAPYTGKWSPGRNIADYCSSRWSWIRGIISRNTAIATFDSSGNYDSVHAAVFLGCTDNGFRVVEQACKYAIRENDYTDSHPLYHKFSVIKVDRSELNPYNRCGKQPSSANCSRGKK